MTGWVHQWLVAVRTRLRQRCDLVSEVIVLRHQLAVLQRTGTRRPCFRPSDRLLWVLLSRWWPNWQRSLIIVQTATVLRWRRRGLRAIWASGSCGRWRGGRPRISSEVRALIVRMSRENFLWGAPRIHGELGRSTTLPVSLKDIAETETANIHEVGTIVRLSIPAPAQQLPILGDSSNGFRDGPITQALTPPKEHHSEGVKATPCYSPLPSA